jgi:phosphohistidine phosphatase
MDQLRQASAIPYRKQDGALEFLLITSQKGHWIFPKGIIDPGETPEETALKESFEEAGIGGKIAGPPVGFYTYRKWGSECAVSVYLLEVDREDEVWPESGKRRRGWFRFEEALELLKGKVLSGLLERAQSILVYRGQRSDVRKTDP